MFGYGRAAAIAPHATAIGAFSFTNTTPSIADMPVRDPCLVSICRVEVARGFDGLAVMMVALFQSSSRNGMNMWYYDLRF
jgi:hypothetical protein